jgi:glycosyltransferase involved in cell wall biosynthesis
MNYGGRKMSAHEPLVTVVTPVYNGGDFLAECIESVLKQTYQNYEYIIVNNCSTDRTLEVAQQYAKQDSRIRVHNNERFVPVIENHNIAFGLIPPMAKYCKVVSADDFLFPECISRLVECAEANPSAALIGSYQLSGEHIRWQGFNYPKTLISGLELCRQMFLGEDKNFGFGTPTSLLYRADLVRASNAFYPNASPHADTSACFSSLRTANFGFVYQILSYERTHQSTQSFWSAQINRYASARLNDLMEYGPLYLSSKEQQQQIKRALNDYHRFLAINWMIGSRNKDFWNYHETRLRELGYPLRPFALLKAATLSVLRETLNPEQAIRKLWTRLSSRPRSAIAQATASSAPDRKGPNPNVKSPESVSAEAR